MSLTNNQLDHLLKLSRLSLGDESYEKMKGQVEQIIDFVGQLDAISFEPVTNTGILPGHLITGSTSFTNQEGILRECKHEIMAHMPTVVFSVKT